MSHNITVNGGSSVLLPTAGKYCDRDIIITAESDSSALDGVIDGSVTEITSNAESVRLFAFYYFENLTSVNLPMATSIEESAFDECRNLTSVNLPMVASMGVNAFMRCENLTSVNLPMATSIEESAFMRCENLTSVNLPMVTSIIDYAFARCYKLKAVVLRSETICALANTNAFSNCYHILGNVNSTHNPNGLKDGYFYVPSALIEEYKVATNWTTFASQFRALEDYTIDGTITGELDESKI